MTLKRTLISQCVPKKKGGHVRVLNDQVEKYQRKFAGPRSLVDKRVDS